MKPPVYHLIILACKLHLELPFFEAIQRELSTGESAPNLATLRSSDEVYFERMSFLGSEEARSKN